MWAASFHGGHGGHGGHGRHGRHGGHAHPVDRRAAPAGQRGSGRIRADSL